jgi:hypothetical protein
MKYRWKKTGEDDYDERWVLYLILDGVQYSCVEILWYSNIAKWSVFVSGFVCEEKVHIERPYELLCDAKSDALTYMKVWVVSGVYQRMNADEKQNWHECEI